MGKFIDMTGWNMSEKIKDSQILVLTKTDAPETYHGNHTYWLCQCKACGKTFKVDGAKLRNGHTKSCGCWQSKDKINIGDKFGKLTVIKSLGPINNDRALYYECLCECGKTIIARGTSLRYKSTSSCGCATYSTHLSNIKQEYTGITFNYLTALFPTKQRISNGSIIWKFKCKCGNECYYDLSLVKNNIVTSCGCRTQSVGEEKIEQILKDHNIIYLHNKQFFKDLKLDNGNLRYDFIIFDNNNNPIRLIEFDGIQHNKSIDFFGGEEKLIKLQERDAFKNNYALQHNIPLVRIPYTELNNISYELLFNNKYLIKGEEKNV